MSHTTVYIESLAVCIIFLATLFILNLKHGVPDYFGCIAAIYGLTILSALLDIAWILVDGKPDLVGIAYFLHTVYLSCFVVIGGLWFSYCCKRLPFEGLHNPLRQAAILAPLALIVAINFLSPITGWTFYLDENARYCRGPLYPVLFISYIYLVAASVLSLKAKLNSQLSVERKRFSSLASFGISPVLLGALSVIAPPGSIPSMQFSILFSLLLMFVRFQETKITNDSLTGLHNRYSLDYAIHERINRFKKHGEPFFILLGDMDDFKTINDTYGHMEGDRMLKVVADILDTIAKDYGSRASRLGGDEFAIVVTCGSLSTAAEIRNRIYENLAQASVREERDLSISIGIAEYEHHFTLIQFLDQADQNMYLEKATHKN